MVEGALDVESGVSQPTLPPTGRGTQASAFHLQEEGTGLADSLCLLQP